MLAKSERDHSRLSLTRLAMAYARSPQAALLDECKTFSMLHQETLFLLNHLARESNGVVLEIGPYIGGSTVAIGEGLKSHANPAHIILELGGAYAHPEYPSTDILADLKKRIADYALRGTHVIVGWSNAPETVSQVETLLAGRSIGLLFIDADGEVERDWNLYSRFLDKDSVIILDDFLVPPTGIADKMGLREWVAQAIAAGRVEDLGAYLWGTWAGRLARQ